MQQKTDSEGGQFGDQKRKYRTEQAGAEEFADTQCEKTGSGPDVRVDQELFRFPFQIPVQSSHIQNRLLRLLDIVPQTATFSFGEERERTQIVVHSLKQTGNRHAAED